MMSTLSLRTKFLAGSLGLVLLLGLGVIILARTALTDKLETQLQKRGLYIARSFAEETVSPILTENMTSLRMLCHDHKTAEDDIEYLFVLNSKGDVLAHTFGESFPTDLLDANALKAGQLSNVRLLHTERGSIFDFAVPILKGDLGSVHLGISAEPIKKSVSDIIKDIAWVIAAVLAFGSIIAVLFTMRITRPLAEFADAAKAVSSGDMRHRVATNTSDELGQLAATFNKMLDDLLKTTVSRDNLEKMVEERTRELLQANTRLLSEIEGHTRDEAALKELNAKLNGLLNAIPDAVFFKDTGGRYLMVNKAFEEAAGATREMYIGKTDGDFMPPDIAAGCRKSDEVVMQNGSPLCVEDVLNGKGEEYTYLDSVKAPIYGPDGSLLGIVGVSRDVTERKRAVKTIEHLSRRNEMILESAGEGICGIDRNGIITFANPAAARMTGWSADELIGRSQHDLLHHSLWDGMPHAPENCRILASMRDGIVQRNADDVFWRKDGVSFPVEYVSTPIREGSDIVGAVVVFSDISERRKIENALLAVTVREHGEKARTEAVLAAIGDNISIHDKDFRVIYQNRVNKETTGEHVGEYCYKAYHDRDEVCEHCHLAETFTDGKVRTVEKRMNTINGTRYVEVTSSPLKEASGKIVGGIELFRDITERKETEKALNKANQTLSSMIRYSPLAIICIDTESNVMIWNPAAERIFGWREEEVLGRKNPIIPEDREKEYRQLSDIVRKGEPYLAREMVRKRKDGSTIHLEAASAAIHDAEGKTIASFALFQDISARYAMEAELRKSEANYRSLLEQASDGIAVIDPQGRYLDVNTRMCEMLGYTRDEFLTLSIDRVVAPGEMTTKTPSRLSEILAGKTVINERLMRRKDGSTFPMEISARRLPDGRLCGIHRDISERKQAEEALKAAMMTAKEEKARSEAVISAIGDSIVILSPEFRILYQNQVDKAMIGDHQGELCYKAYEGREVQCPDCPAVPAFRDGKIHRGERSATTIAGDMHMDITASPLLDASGKVTAVIEMVKDISERKRAEEALRRSHDELDILVKERTAELTMLNDQLRDLFTYIQDTREKERTVIAREIHDELGQALTALKIDLSWLKRRLPVEKKPLVEKIQSMSELIETTIEAVKRISMELRPGVLDHLGLTAAIEWQAGEFQKRTGIHCDILCEPEDIELDRERSTTIFRVFQETLTNVARHAKAKKVVITLEEESDDILLRVEDNGKGILEKHLSDPKSLGLIGMRERVHFWGGKLDIRGALNRGTEVTVRIPKESKGGMA